MTPQAEDSARLQELLGELYAERAARAGDAVGGDRCRPGAPWRCARVSMWKFDRVGDELTPALLRLEDCRRRASTPRNAACAAAGVIDYFNSLVDAGTYAAASTR